MSIKEILESGASVTLAVTANDLQEFALTLLSEAEAKAATLREQQPEQYLTTGETAKLFGVSTNTLWRWAKSGYLKPIKTGRTPHYRLSDVENLLNGKEGT